MQPLRREWVDGLDTVVLELSFLYAVDTHVIVEGGDVFIFDDAEDVVVS